MPTLVGTLLLADAIGKDEKAGVSAIGRDVVNLEEAGLPWLKYRYAGSRLSRKDVMGEAVRCEQDDRTTEEISAMHADL